jgi:hypothetical protein
MITRLQCVVLVLADPAGHPFWLAQERVTQ